MGSLDSSDDPIAYGKRLLPSIVDERAKSSYSRPIASIARSRDPADGFEDISYARFANAVNRACHWLDAELPKSVGKDDISYTAYLGPNDLRYVVLWCATLKTGRKVVYLAFSRLGKPSYFYADLVPLNSQHGICLLVAIREDRLQDHTLWCLICQSSTARLQCHRTYREATVSRHRRSAR